MTDNTRAIVAILDLTAHDQDNDTLSGGTIKVRLSRELAVQASIGAISRSEHDIESGGVNHLTPIAESRPVQLSTGTINIASRQTDFLKPLEGVLSKLNAICKCVDEIARVSVKSRQYDRSAHDLLQRFIPISTWLGG